ncbi:hypothetical protein [Tissierella sp. P1]|nr:hypothetical protein [Tissierella sp. P1]
MIKIVLYICIISQDSKEISIMEKREMRILHIDKAKSIAEEHAKDLVKR